MTITSDEYNTALRTNTCIWCKGSITTWKKIVRSFWAPWWCDQSIFWKICCSSQCHTNFLEHELEELEKRKRN